MNLKQRELINSLSQKIVDEISLILGNDSDDQMEVSKKNDSSVVTNVDLRLSALIKALVHQHLGDEFIFFCEEDHEALSFPTIVLDPIDGTKGLVTGTFESAVSLAIMESPDIKTGYGYIFNPFKGFEMSSDTVFLKTVSKPLDKKLGFVSRSEWEKGIYKDLHDDDISLSPMGSIAYKLALLAAGACDFVFSANPKNIWDIAAGTILCRQRDIYLYDSHGEQVDQLKDAHIKGPMFWCREETKSTIMAMMEKRKKS